jgi:DNA-binding response OmpR family regulator
VDFVVGLDAGADDYVGKPFRLAELMARVRALMRRRGGSEDTAIAVGDIRLEPAARRVLVGGSEVILANKEYELLKVLLDRAGEVVSRDVILQEVWGDADLRGSKTLDMHMSWLRRKIGDEGPVAERRIATVRGVGFRLNT